LLEW